MSAARRELLAKMKEAGWAKDMLTESMGSPAEDVKSLEYF